LRLGQREFWTVARRLALVALAAATLTGCAEHIGKSSTAGAIGEFERERAVADKDKSKQVLRVAGERAVEGAVAALDEPEQREAIQRLISDAVAAATAAAVREATTNMIAELGPEGRGPLGVSLARTSEQVSSAAVGGIGAELAGLIPECNGPDRMDCIERRLQQTARTTAASFTSGVKESIGWHLLFIMFVLGAAGGVLGAWLWSLRPVRRRDFRTA